MSGLTNDQVWVLFLSAIALLSYACRWREGRDREVWNCIRAVVRMEKVRRREAAKRNGT